MNPAPTLLNEWITWQAVLFIVGAAGVGMVVALINDRRKDKH